MMIPHHQSANEMAQVLLKEPTLIISSSLWVTSKLAMPKKVGPFPQRFVPSVTRFC
jgi:hypothetical protein